MINGAKFSFLSQYMSSCLPRMDIRLLDLCGLMLEYRLTARKTIEDIDVGEPLTHNYLYFFIDIDSHVSIVQSM